VARKSHKNKKSLIIVRIEKNVSQTIAKGPGLRPDQHTRLKKRGNFDEKRGFAKNTGKNKNRQRSLRNSNGRRIKREEEVTGRRKKGAHEPMPKIVANGTHITATRNAKKRKGRRQKTPLLREAQPNGPEMAKIGLGKRRKFTGEREEPVKHLPAIGGDHHALRVTTGHKTSLEILGTWGQNRGAKGGEGREIEGKITMEGDKGQNDMEPSVLDMGVGQKRGGK
jgi:hypothetical protein